MATPLTRQSSKGASARLADLTADSSQSNACIIAAGTSIQGQFSSVESIRLDGTVDGDLSCGSKLVVGAKGKILGNAKAKHIIVKGHIEGDVLAEEHLHLFPSARITGNIQARFFSVEEGAAFSGNSKTSG